MTASWDFKKFFLSYSSVSFHFDTGHKTIWLCKVHIFWEGHKFCEISTLILTAVHTVRSKVEISQNFVAFSEYRDWFPKFANGLNIKIDIVHKVCIWVTKVSFCQNDPIIGESFWQKNSLVTFIFFELCLFWYFANSQILGISLYVLSMWISKIANIG